MREDCGRFLGPLAQAEEVLLLCSSDGGIMDANWAAERLYGYSHGELLNLNISDLRAEECPDLSMRADLAERYGLRLIATHRDKWGNAIPVTVQSRGLRIRGQRCLLCVIVQNPTRNPLPLVSEQVKTAAGYALVQSKQVDEIIQSFAMISQFATAGMMLLDASGTILAVNASISSFLGYSRQDLIGGHFLFCAFPEDFPAGAAMFTALASGRIRSYEQEQRFVTSSGAIAWARLNATALVSDKDRRMLCVCQIEDITAEKQRRDELRHYAALVRNADVAIYSFNLHGEINSWNPAAERTYGYLEGEIRGRMVSVLFPEDADKETVPYREQMLSGQALQVEATRRRKDGRLINVALNLSPIRNERNEIVGVSVLARDITELKRLQSEIAQLDRLNLVGGIAASIGHEVRNPMTTVRGYLQLMLRRPELRPLQAQMDLMIEELDRVNGIISEFLSLARNKPTEMALHSLSGAVRILLPLMEAEAALRGNEIVLKLDDIPDIRIDLKEIRQLLLNLVRNGLEAMGQGGRLTIATVLRDQEVVLEVTDQGCGIPEEYQAKLGTAFFTTKDSGTGLGLLTCYSIVSKHRAKMTFDTSPSGSTFRVHFRLPDDHAAAPQDRAGGATNHNLTQ